MFVVVEVIIFICLVLDFMLEYIMVFLVGFDDLKILRDS